jgi:hypothetical protein
MPKKQDNHVLTKMQGNLRGLSTDSIFIRTPNQADTALNLVLAPDRSTRPRRGYQCQVATIGGMGTSTYYNPLSNSVETLTIGANGILYKKIQNQLTIIYYPTNASQYLTFSIFTDPAALLTGGSISCQVIANLAAKVNGNQNNVTTIIVQPGNSFSVGKTAQFLDIFGVTQTKVLTGWTITSITFAGQVSVADNTYINQVSYVQFGNGFDEATPFTLYQFVEALTMGSQGIQGVAFEWNGPFVTSTSSLPAAFLDLVEPMIISSSSYYAMNYYWWNPVNKTVPVTFPGSADLKYQNSSNFENASFQAFRDVLYISNGFDFPQKYDGQTVYQTGLPQGRRIVSIVDDTIAPVKPFVTGNVYTYGITYSQIDAVGREVEGAISFSSTHTVVAANCALDVTVDNIISGTGWNTNCAIATGGSATVYGPDNNGFYYDTILVNSNTLNVGDTAFYIDQQDAIVSSAQVNQITLPVYAGHGAEVGDIAVFMTNDIPPKEIQEIIAYTTPTSITLSAEAVSVANNTFIAINRQSQVFGDVGIVNGDQYNVGISVPVVLVAGHTLQVLDVVNFVDPYGNTQMGFVSSITPTSAIINPPLASPTPFLFSYLNGTLIYSSANTVGYINVQRLNSGPAYLGTAVPISNNLAINIYRSKNGSEDLLYLITIPNNSTLTTQTYVDEFADDQITVPLNSISNANTVNDFPPVSKYILGYQNQMLFAGGTRLDEEILNNSDTVFFSYGDYPENVQPATNSFDVPTDNDQITGIGIAGTTLIVFKNRSISSVTGVLSTGQFKVTDIASGQNIGCVASATIQSLGSLLYFLHTNGVYAITENQFFPTDTFGNPIPISSPIDVFFRTQNYLPQTQFRFKQAVALNYTKDHQYLLYMPCENQNATQNAANTYSILFCYDYAGKNWYTWNNINAAGGIFAVGDDLYFHERRYSGFVGNTFNLYKQHRFYRLIDYADHTQAITTSWRSSWEDLGQAEVRKKFTHCMLLMDRFSTLDQVNAPVLQFSSYLDRIPNLQNTIATITTVNNTQNSTWSNSQWGWGVWSGYQDSFIRINLKRGTVAKSMQVGFTMTALNTSWSLTGFQLEAVPEFRKTFVR